MFIFRKVRKGKRRAVRQVLVEKDDWITLKSLKSKLKKDIIDIEHDMIMVYSGFLYGVDHEAANKIERDLMLIAGELKKTRYTLSVYKQRFGEIEIPAHDDPRKTS